MRPLPGDEASRRQHAATDHGRIPSRTSSSAHMSFFLADEATVDSYLDQPSISGPGIMDTRKASENDRMPSSHTIHEQVETFTCVPNRPEEGRGPADSPLRDTLGPSPTHVPATAHTQPILSRPITPITLGTSVTGSVLSSASSRRNSFAGSVSDNAIISDDEDRAVRGPVPGMMDSGTVPQLVMPSIKMPSRRPFTETGKSLGRLKIMLAGQAGVGKTSLVKAIVQTSEHIVHVDPFAAQGGSRRSSKSTVRPRASNRRKSTSTEEIDEIFASTKPYPGWWTGVGESHVGQRRKSLGDQVLDRNICFVDTPGLGAGSSILETIVPCVGYVESHFSKLFSDALSESETLNLLSGDGGFQVDVVLYLIQRELSSADLEYLKRLAPLTNIIPVLSQTDRLTLEEQTACKRQIMAQLREAAVRPFTFATTPHNAEEDDNIVYSASSLAGSDHDVMDASLLMSPDYVRPLVFSELKALVDQLFSPNGMAWLRHSAAKKYMAWRDNSSASRPRHLYRPLQNAGPSPSGLIGRDAGAIIRRPTLELTCVTEETYGGGDTRLHLVDWAADLQRSLSIERAQYKALAPGELAVWPTEKLDECVKAGTLVPARNSKKRSRARRGYSVQCRKSPRRQDPLGLLLMAADLKVKGWVALKVMSSLGILGGMAFWLARQRWQTQPTHLADEWSRMWGFDL